MEITRISMFIFRRYCAVIAILALFFCSSISNAATRTWDGEGTTGNWSEAANWSDNATPEAGDSVVFDGTSTKASTIDASFPGTVNSISLAAGYTAGVTLARSIAVSSSFSQAEGAFACGAYDFQTGSFSQSGGSFEASSGTLTISNTFNRTGGTFDHNNGTVKFMANQDTYDVTAGDAVFYGLSFDMSSGWEEWDFNNIVLKDSFTVEADVEVKNTYTGKNYNVTATGSPVMTVNGTLEFPSTAQTKQVYFGGSEMTGGTFSVILYRDLRIEDGNAACSANVSFEGSSDATVLQSAGYIRGDITVNKPDHRVVQGSNITVSGSGPGDETSSFTLAAGSYECGSYSLSAGDYTQTGGYFDCINGGLTLSGGFVQSGGTFEAPSGTLTISNTFNRTGGTFNHNSGTVKFMANRETYDVTAGGTAFYNLGFDLYSDMGGFEANNIVLKDSFTVEADVEVKNTYTGKNYNVTATGSPVMTVNGTLEFPSTAQTKQVYFGGSEMTGGTFSVILYRDLRIEDGNAACSANVSFEGSTDATILQSAGTIAGDITVNKPDHRVVQGSNITVSGSGPGDETSSFTLAAGSYECGSYSLSAGDYTQTGGYFDCINGGLTLSGGFVQSGGTFEAPSGTLTISNTFNRTGGTFNHNSGTVTFYAGGSSYSITTGAALFHNVLFDGSGSSTVTLNNNFTAEADVKVKNTGSDNYSVVGSGSPVITVNGTLEFPSTVQTGQVTFGSGLKVALYRDLIMSDSNASCSSDIDLVGGSNVSITQSSGTMSGDWIINKPGAMVRQESDASLSGEMAAGSFTLSAGTYDIGNKTLTAGNFSQSDGIFEGGEGNLTLSAGMMGGDGTFTQSGGTFEAPSGILTVANTFNRTGGVFTHNNGTVRFYAGDSSYSITTAAALFYNVMFDGSGSSTVTLNNSFTAEADVKIKNTGSSDYSVVGSGSPVITVSGTLEFPSTAQTGYVYFGGSEWGGSTIAAKVFRDLILSDANAASILSVTLLGSADAVLSQSAGTIRGSISVQKPGATVTQTTGIAITGSGMGAPADLYIDAGTLDTAGYNLTAPGVFSNTGKLRVSGSETLSFTKDTDSGTVEYAGTGTGMSYGAAYWNLEINPSSALSQFNAPGSMTVGADLLINNGVLFMNSNDLSLAGSFVNRGTLKVNGSETLGGSFVNYTSSGTVEYAGGGSYTLQAGAGGTSYYDLLISGSGSFTGVALTDYTVNGTFAQTDGTASFASGPQNMAVYGDFIRSGGTFEAEGKLTVVLAGALPARVEGSTLFYNLTCTSEGKALSFEAGAVQTVEGTAILKGGAGGVLYLRSSLPDTQWKLNPSGIRDISYVNVKDSYNTSATPINPENSVDSGNNTRWFGDPPIAPADFAAVSQSQTALGYTWTRSSTNESGFRILDELNAEKLLVLPAQTATSETGLLVNTQYTRKVEAYNDDGAATSETVSVYTSIEACAGATWEGIGENSITIHSSNEPSDLSAGSSGILFENVTAGTDSGWIKANTWASSGLVPGTAYSFRISTRNGDGVIRSTEEVGSKTTERMPTPEAPSSFEAAPVSASSLAYTWTRNSTNEAGFRILDGSDNIKVLVASSEVTTSESGMSANTSYTRKVQAYNSFGASTSETYSRYTSIEAASGISWEAITSSSITVHASNEPSNLYSGDSGILFENVTKGTSSGWIRTNTWVEAGLSPQTQYIYRAVTRNGEALLTATAEASQTTLPPSPTPEAPSEFRAVSSSTASLNYTWTRSSTNETGFRILDELDNIKALASSGEASASETGLSSNTRYTRKVQAYNSFGASTSETYSRYTSIEAASGISWEAVTSSSITAHASNEPANLSSGDSGILFENVTKGASSGWVRSNTWTSSGLEPSTYYNFRITTRNGNAVLSATQEASSRTLAESTINSPEAKAFSAVTTTVVQANWGANGNPDGTEYYCENTSKGTNSGWTALLEWKETALDASTAYSYRAKAKNASGLESAWAELGEAGTSGYSSFNYIKADGIKLLNEDIIRNKPELEIRALSSSTISENTFRLWIDNIQVSDGTQSPGGYDRISGSGSDIVFYYAPKTALDVGEHSLKFEVYDEAGSILMEERTSLKVREDKGVSGPVLTYPNPLDPAKATARISYTLNSDTDIILYLFDTAGKIVWKADYVSGLMGGKAGYNEVEWDGSDFGGRRLPNDIYLLRVVEKATGNMLGKSKVVILRSMSSVPDNERPNANSFAAVIGISLLGLLGAGGFLWKRLKP